MSRNTLKLVQKTGLKGDHHFFITFVTKYPGVMISDKLLDKYPDEMTIILQHQFWELEVDDNYFSVVLSFDNVHESLTVPFDSLTAFADPSVKFGLQFRRASIHNEEHTTPKSQLAKAGAKKRKSKQGNNDSDDSSDSNVIMLDSFRKK